MVFRVKLVLYKTGEKSEKCSTILLVLKLRYIVIRKGFVGIKWNKIIRVTNALLAYIRIELE